MMGDAVFSENAKYFACLSEDGRLKIWDVETNVLKQEYTPDLHLSSPPTCLQWLVINSSPEHPKKGNKRKLSGPDISTNNTESQCIALGTSSGKLLLYSVAEAKLVTILEDSQSGKVRNVNITCLEWSRKYGLFSSSESQVCEWNLQSSNIKYKYNLSVESNNKQSSVITAMKMVPHNLNTNSTFLVTASSRLRLWSLEAGACRLLRALGPAAASPCIALHARAHNGRTLLASANRNERLLTFWDISLTEQDLHKARINGAQTKQRRKSMSDGDVTAHPSKQRRKSESEGDVTLTPTYNFLLEDAPRMLDVELRGGEGEGGGEGGCKVNIAAVTRSGVLHYYSYLLNGACKKPIKPSVTLHVATAEARPLPLQCCRLPAHQPHHPHHLLLGYETTPANLVFELVIPDMTTRTQVIIRSLPTKQKKKKGKDKSMDVEEDDGEKIDNRVSYIEPAADGSRKRPTSGKPVEVPMESRLENLTIEADSGASGPLNQNMARLLVQGLHSGDKTLILSVLQRSDSAVALRTTAALPARYVPALLRQLADLAARKTSQCRFVVTWTRALVRTQAAILLATLHRSATNEHFAQLLAVLTQRRSHLCQLLNLRGRLELCAAQRDRADWAASMQPVLHYDDESAKEDSDVELGQGSDSESMSDDWEEGSQPDHAMTDSEND